MQLSAINRSPASFVRLYTQVEMGGVVDTQNQLGCVDELQSHMEMGVLHNLFAHSFREYLLGLLGF
jgi:hypothetical protein